MSMARGGYFKWQKINELFLNKTMYWGEPLPCLHKTALVFLMTASHKGLRVLELNTEVKGGGHPGPL